MNGRGFGTAILLATVVCGLSCGGTETRGDDDVYKGIETTLRELDVNDDRALEELAQAIRERSLKQPRKIVELLHADDEDDASKAAAVTLALGELAQSPLLETLDPDAPEDLVWEMQLVVDIQLASRAKIVTNLERMLDDKTPVEPPALPPQVEEEPPLKRVCDEAYLMMRKLLSLETEDTELLNVDIFLDLSEEERDEEIARAVSSQKWDTAVEESKRDRRQ